MATKQTLQEYQINELTRAVNNLTEEVQKLREANITSNTKINIVTAINLAAVAAVAVIGRFFR